METENKIIYNWSCNTVDIYPKQGKLTNVVYKVHYVVTGGINYETQPITATKIGTQMLNTKNVTNFIPFNELTSVHTIEWTKSSMGEETVLAIENDIAEQIELQRNPVSITMIVPDPPQPAPVM